MSSVWRVVAAIAASGCGRVSFDAQRDAASTIPSDGDCAAAIGLADGLVGWWKLDESSGTIAYDSAAGNDGALVGGTTHVAGHLGGAIELDGTSGHVDIGGSVAYATHSAAFSFSAWADLASWAAGAPDIMQIATDNATSPFHVLWSDDPSYDGLSTGDGDGSWIPTRTDVEPSLNAWHHVAMIYDGSDPQSISSFTFYLDNVTQPLEQAAGYATQANATRIGAAEVSDNNWSGMIDDVRIYDRALSSADVAALFSLTCD